jgi:hypothetical protein
MWKCVIQTEEEFAVKRFTSLTISVAMFAAASGCSSKPRYFEASLTAEPAEQSRFEKDMALCRELVGRGYKSDFAAKAAAVGAGTVASFGAAAASVATTTGFLEATAASTAFGVVMPPVGALAGFGVSRAIRSGREKKLKTNLTNCLSEYGYSVAQWVPAKRPALIKPAPAKPTEPPAAPRP